MGPTPEETREGGPTKSSTQPSSQLMMTSNYNLDKRLHDAEISELGDIETAAYELRGIGEASAKLKKELYEIVQDYKQRLSKKQQRGVDEDIELFRDSLDRMIRVLMRHYKTLVEEAYDQKISAYKEALRAIGHYIDKYNVSDKKELLELLREDNHSEEVISAVERALELGKDLEDARDKLSSMITNIEEEKKKAFEEMNSTYSGLQKYIEDITNKIVNGFIEKYRNIIDKIKGQIESDIGGRAKTFDKHVEYALNRLESLKDKVSKVQNKLGEERKRAMKKLTLYENNGNPAGINQARKHLINIEKREGEIETIKYTIYKAIETIKKIASGLRF